GVLAPRDRDERPLARTDHPVGADRVRDLFTAALHEAIGTVGGAAVPQVDDALLVASMTLHGRSLTSGHDRPDLHGVALVQDGVARHQFVAADDQNGFSVEPQPPAQLVGAEPARNLGLALGVVELDLHRRRLHVVDTAAMSGIDTPKLIDRNRRLKSRSPRWEGVSVERLSRAGLQGGEGRALGFGAGGAQAGALEEGLVLGLGALTAAAGHYQHF